MFRQEGTAKDNPNVENAGSGISLIYQVNKRDVYLGEGIVAGVKIYTRTNIAGSMR